MYRTLVATTFGQSPCCRPQASYARSPVRSNLRAHRGFRYGLHSNISIHFLERDQCYIQRNQIKPFVPANIECARVPLDDGATRVKVPLIVIDPGARAVGHPLLVRDNALPRPTAKIIARSACFPAVRFGSATRASTSVLAKDAAATRRPCAIASNSSAPMLGPDRGTIPSQCGVCLPNLSRKNRQHLLDVYTKPSCSSLVTKKE